MEITKEIIALLAGLGVFFLVITLFAIQHAARAKNRKSGRTWLFENWQVQIYDSIFGVRETSHIGKKIGVDMERYEHNCKLTRQKSQAKVVIIDKLCGFVIIGVFCIIGVISMNIPLMVIGLVIAFPFIALPIHFVESAAEKRKRAVEEELPRFLDMLYTALLIGMPVDQAIEITAKSLKNTVLAEELLSTMIKPKVGASSWQEALETLAADYNVDTLSDFVLDITNAYSLGASILDSVERKSHDIKQSNLIAMKERASKLTNTILFPVLIFKIIPLLLIMCIPIIKQLQASGF